MKKILALLLAAVLCVSLSACINIENLWRKPEASRELTVDEKLLLGDWEAYAIIRSSSDARYLSGDEYAELRLYDDLTGILSAEVESTELRESITWSYLEDDVYETSYDLMMYVDGELWLSFEEMGTYLIFQRQ